MSIVNMPLVTWGLNSLENRMIAHGNAINNTARQVAGSIGTAILITVMAIATKLNQSAGEMHATLSGIHAAFAVGTGFSCIALIMAIVCTKKEKRVDV